MSQFDHLKALNISEATSKLPMPDISPDAVLELRVADESNKGYWNAIMILGAEDAEEEMPKRGKPSPGAMARLARKWDHKLFAKHVIVGWTGVVDPDGNEITFSVENAQELMDILYKEASWVFDKIRARANSPEAFVDWEMLVPQTDGLVGNSESDSSGT